MCSIEPGDAIFTLKFRSFNLSSELVASLERVEGDSSSTENSRECRQEEFHRT